MGLSHTRARSLVVSAMEQLREDNRAEAACLRDIETARLDKLIAALWPMATGVDEDGEKAKPDISASRQVLSLLESRRRLWGIDAPEKVDMRSDGLTPEAIQEIRQSILGIEPTE